MLERSPRITAMDAMKSLRADRFFAIELSALEVEERPEGAGEGEGSCVELVIMQAYSKNWWTGCWCQQKYLLLYRGKLFCLLEKRSFEGIYAQAGLPSSGGAAWQQQNIATPTAYEDFCDLYTADCVLG